MKNVIRLISLSSVFVFAATGCGGGGGGGSGGGFYGQNSIQGTVAVGKPLAGATVTVFSTKSIGSGGYQVVETMTDAEGKYSVQMGILPPPYVVTVKSFGHPVFPVLSSVATKAGTINVTPLTDLLVAQLTRKPQSWGVVLSDMPILEAVTDQDIANARQNVLNYLLTRPSKTNQSITAPINASAIGDFISTPFQPKAGDTYDDILEQLAQSLLENENIHAIQEHMLNSSVPAMDVQAQPAGIIRCEGNICGQSPSGTDTISTPHIAKYSIVKAFMRQVVLNDPFPQVNCGPTPQISGFAAGANNLQIDGSVLRVNNNGYALSISSLIHSVALSIDQKTSPSTDMYIKSFGGGTTALVDNHSWIYMTFDGQANIKTIQFYETRNGVPSTVNCTKI